MKKLTGITVLFLLFMHAAFAQYTIKGKVVDEQNLPLPGVNISTGKKQLTVSDNLGNYSFPFSSKTISITFSHVGYEPVTINITDEQVPVVILKKSGLLLSESVVNSFESKTIIRSVPASVGLLNKSMLERYNNASLVSAVNTVPGVKMDERSPGSYRLSIRGNLLRSTFGVRNVKVYWNGIPFTDANGNTYLNEISPANINSIEILKGPSGSIYGAGTAGVVLLSSTGRNKEKSISFQSTAGSYGLFTANASYDQSDEKSNSTMSVSHQQADGYRKQTGMRRDVVNFAGTYFVNEKQSVSTNAFYSDLYYQTPGGLTQAEMSKDPRQARPKAGIFNGAEAQKAALYLKTIYAAVGNEYAFNNKWSNTTSVYISHTNFRNPTIRNYEVKTERGVGTRSVIKYKGRSFTATFGGEYQYSFANTSTFGNKLGELDTLQFHDEIDSRQFNLFLQADISLMKDLVLNAGLSYNNFHYGFVRLYQPLAAKRSSDFTPQLVPRISLIKKMKNRMSMYVSVSKGYSPPSIDEVHAGDGNFNTALNAETVINYEAGIKADIIRDKLFTDISYYSSGLKNTIVSRRDASGADYYVNAGKTKQQGLEVSINYVTVNNSNRFLRRIQLWANYTNIHARFVNYEQGTAKFDGNKLTGTTPNVFVSGVDINTAIGLYTNLTYSYTDMIPLNDANTFFANAYNLFFARLGYKVNLGKMIQADIFISLDKSFNEPYSLGNDLNATGNRFYNPSAPENISGGFRLKFLLK